MADLEAIAENLSSLTVMEAANLVKMLEEKWGVSAAAPVAMAAAGAAAAAAAAEEEQTEFEVDPHGGRRQEDQRDQGRPRGDQPRSQGGQGPGRRRAEDRSRKA